LKHNDCEAGSCKFSLKLVGGNCLLNGKPLSDMAAVVQGTNCSVVDYDCYVKQQL